MEQSYKNYTLELIFKCIKCLNKNAFVRILGHYTLLRVSNFKPVEFESHQSYGELCVSYA